MAAALRWLHFTDLHQGQRDQDWLWPTVRQLFFADLAKIRARTGPWDVVFFTGDLVNTGKQEEFAALSKTLEEIFAELTRLCDGSPPLLLAVPGNHDLIRPSGKTAAVRSLLSAASDSDVLGYLFDGDPQEYLHVVEQAFAPYQEWWTARTQQTPLSWQHGLLPGDFSVSIERGGVRFGVAGLNSSYLQLGGGDAQGKLVVHPRQFHQACGGDGPRWSGEHDACFLLTHHPPDWLHEESRKMLHGEIAHPGRFAVHLFGHMHEGVSRSYSENGYDERNEWQGRSLFGLEKTREGLDRSHGYSAGSLELSGDRAVLRQWPRKAERNGQGHWNIFPDHSSFKLEEDEGTRSRSIPINRRPRSTTVAVGHEGSAQGALDNFLARCGRRYASMRVASLESAETQRLLADVQLQELYVEPRLTDDRHAVVRSEEERRLRRELLDPDLTPQRRAQIKQQLDQIETARWAHDESGSRQSAELSSLLQQHRHFVIIGTPGAGKTTLLQYLAWASVQAADERQRRLGTAERLVPLLGALRDFARQRRRRPDLELDQYLLARAARRDAVLKEALREALISGSALILLDALDEVPREKERRRLSEDIASFLAAHPQVRCVITTRPYGYQPIGGRVTHQRIEPLSASGMRILIRKRAEAIARRKGLTDLGLARREASRVAGAIASHRSVEQLARNPLLLVMICDLCQGGASLPAERAQLYDRAVQTLLERWNLWRSLDPQHKDVPLLPAAELRRALARIALRQRKEQHPILHHARLVRWLASALRNESRSASQVRELAERYITAAAGQAGVLDERGPGQFVFWHQTFEEYLAAVALTMPGHKAEQRLLARSSNPRFKEVFQLALGELARVQNDDVRAHRIVRSLLTDCSDPLEPVCHERLRLAARCVAEQPWIEAKLANTILCRLAQVVQGQPYELLLEDLAASLAARPALSPTPALVSALTPLVRSRRMRYAGNGTLRQSALRILLNTQPPDPAVASLFVELLQVEEDTPLRTLAAAGLGLSSGWSWRALAGLAPILDFDQELIDRIHDSIRAARASVEPMLLDWVTTEGPDLRLPGAVALVLLGLVNDATVAVLIQAAEKERSSSWRGLNTARSLLYHLATSSARARELLVASLPEAQRHGTEEHSCFWALQRAAESSDECLDFLLAQAWDRNSALWSLLATLAHQDERVLGKLKAQLASSDPSHQYAIIDFLLAQGEQSSSDVLAVLLGLLDVGQPDLRLRAAARLLGVHLGFLWDYVNRYQRRSLTVLGEPEATRSRVVPALKALLLVEDAAVRAQAAVLLVLLGLVDALVIDVLTNEEVLREETRRELWSELTPHLHLHRSRILQRLTEQIAHSDSNARQWIRQRFARLETLSPEIQEKLLARLNEPDLQVRACAALILADAGVSTPAVQRTLVDSLSTLSPLEQDLVVGYFAGFAEIDHGVFAALLARFAATYAEQARSEVAARLSTLHPDRWTYAAATVLAKAAQRQPEELEYLADSLISEDRALRAVARLCVQSMDRGDQTAQATVRLSQLVAERLNPPPKPQRLWPLLEEHAFFGVLNQESQEALWLRCTEHHAERIRLACAQQLLHCAQHRARVCEIIEQAVLSADLDVQLDACSTLVHWELTSTHLPGVLRGWLDKDSILLNEGLSEAFWFDGMVVLRGVRRAIPEQQLERRLLNFRHLLRESDKAEVQEGRRLSVRAALWLVQLGAVDAALLNAVTAWLSEQSPARKLFAAYLLLAARQWPCELEDAAMTWLDSSDMRLREAAVILLGRVPRAAAQVDARLGQWLEEAHGDFEKAQQVSRWLWNERLFGRAIVASAVTAVTRRNNRATFYAGDRVLKQIERIRSRRPRLLAALRAVLAQAEDEPRLAAAVFLYRLGCKETAVLEHLLRAELTARVRGFPLGLQPRPPDLVELARDAYVRSALRMNLQSSHDDLRLASAEALMDIDDRCEQLGPVLRALLISESTDIEKRIQAANLLAKLEDPADRPAIAACLLTAASDMELVQLWGPRLLSLLDGWSEWAPRCRDLYEQWMRHGLLNRGSDCNQWMEHLADKVDGPVYESWLFACLNAEAYAAAKAFNQLAERGLFSGDLLKIALGWLIDGDEHSARRRVAEEYLRGRELLPAKRVALRTYQDHDALLPEDPARKMQTLARAPEVVPLLASLADGAQASGVEAVLKLLGGQELTVADVQALAALVTHRPDDQFRQRFARTWLFRWISTQKRYRRDAQTS